MIGSIYNSTQITHTAIKSNGAANGREFGELLNEAAKGKSDISVPDKWITEGCIGSSAVEEVLKYLDDLGEDSENRTPTHDITDEQIEWLRSRHDIEKLRSGESGYNASGGSAEIQNFYADLVYLNVFSPQDTKTAITSGAIIPAYLVEEVAPGVYRVKVDLNDPLIHGHIDWLGDGGSAYCDDCSNISGCNDLIEMALRSLSMQTKLLNLIKDKSEDPKRSESMDTEAIADMEKLITDKTECCQVLQKIFGQV